MNVGQLIGYLKDYDEDEEVEVEVHFGEAGESRASTFDAALPSRGEVGGGDESPWPTIGANVGLGTTAGAGLDLLVEHARGIEYHVVDPDVRDVRHLHEVEDGILDARLDIRLATFHGTSHDAPPTSDSPCIRRTLPIVLSRFTVSGDKEPLKCRLPFVCLHSIIRARLP